MVLQVIETPSDSEGNAKEKSRKTVYGFKTGGHLSLTGGAGRNHGLNVYHDDGQFERGNVAFVQPKRNK